MIPDSVVLWVLGEELRGELEGGVGVVIGFDLEHNQHCIA